MPGYRILRCARSVLPLLALIIGTPAFAAAPATATVGSSPTVAPTPTAPHFGSLIEGYAPYQPEKFCRNSVEPGVQDFERLLTATYTDTAIVSDLRPCVPDSTSEHYDGRAVDWGVDYRNKAQRSDGKALLRWLFTSDAQGDHDAMLRRLGIMYIIWNHRIWGTWDQQWDPYKCKGPTACHVDHMHFSFDWAGAEAKTSWFTGTVLTHDVGYPPHRHHKRQHSH